MNRRDDVATFARDATILRRRYAHAQRLIDWQSPASVWAGVETNAADAARSLCDAFALYLDHCDGAARLLVLPGHGDAVRGAVTARDAIVSQVVFVGAEDTSERKAALLSADALVLTTGDTRATCEALALGVPIVARAAALDGIDTNAALVWSEDSPELFAASVERLRADASLRSILRERGFTRIDAWLRQHGTSA